MSLTKITKEGIMKKQDRIQHNSFANKRGIFSLSIYFTLLLNSSFTLQNYSLNLNLPGLANGQKFPIVVLIKILSMNSSTVT
jgi:hypothetical protein